jgi:serine/threonine protein kinase/Tfp pilus assembly protein PilF
MTTDPTAGDRFSRVQASLAGRYRLERELGRGGMATVYLADDLKHHRSVAIKVLRAELAATVGADRFLREIEIAARLAHPHILPLHDSGTADGLLYYVMPYVAGESLRAWLERERPLALDAAVKVARDVAEALDHAHHHGIVHRDIKPENILLEEGHAVVADFGLAAALSAVEPGRLTGAGFAAGTPEYMSPEQAAGEPQLDSRTDVYSLGCVLYEMLAGEPPFHGATPRAVMARHVTDPVPPLATVRPDLPPGVVRAVERALAKAPAARYASASDFVQALTVADEADLADATATALAVLAFANMSGNPDAEYLSDGISEEIINALSRLAGVRVASRTSSFAFKGSREDVRVIGRRLGVGAVLEGGVRRSGDHLRVTAQLVSVDDGCQLWAGRYDREMRDVFLIQEEIAQSIARALQVVFDARAAGGLHGVRTPDVRAYEYYLRGRQCFHQFRRKSIEFAREMFHHALAIDPGYAPAHAGVADCSSFLHMYWGGAAADLEQADTASRRALELDPRSAEAHAARGLAVALSGRFEDAEREFLRAIALNRGSFEAHYFYARACFQSGRLERAAELFVRAAEVREDYQAWFFAAQSHAALHRDAEAMAAYRTALASTERHLELDPGDARACTMGAVALCRLGEPEKGLEWIERALTIDPDDAGVSYNAACLYALEGQADRAIACLREAVRGGFWHRNWARNDPDLDGLRGDPRFQELRAAGS